MTVAHSPAGHSPSPDLRLDIEDEEGYEDDFEVDPLVLAYEALVMQQASYLWGPLRELHKEWLGPRGLFATFIAEIEQLGRQAPGLEDTLSITDPKRVDAVERAVAFVLARSNRRIATLNPLRSLSRMALCCIAYSENSEYTLAERFTAYEAIRQGDSDFFIKLIATTRGVSERRIVFRGLLEHFDRLTPLECSIFPTDYRAAQQANLDREEAVHGKWMFKESVITLLETLSPVELLRQVMGEGDSVS